MTIAQAFNDIAVAQGGAASTSGTIAGAIDALNDVLAGSDQDAASTIEDAVRLLGQHIGGASPTGTIEITENGEGIDVAQYAYADVNVSGGATVGNPVQLIPVTNGSKSGDYIYAGEYGGVNALYLGENVVMALNSDYSSITLSSIASGVTMKSDIVPALGNDDDAETYLVTAKPHTEYPEYEVIDTITSIETDVHTYVDNENKYFTLTIPEIPEGAYLGIRWQYGD